MKKSQKTKLIGVLLGGLLATVPNGFAEAINITRRDPNVAGPSLGFGGGPNSTNVNDEEDNEVENGHWSWGDPLNPETSQRWDLEAMTLNITGTSAKLSLIGGYDFQNPTDGINPGQLFIRVGKPQVGPTDFFGDPQVENSAFGGDGYLFAIDFNTKQLYTLNANTDLNTVIFDMYGSSPWTVAGNATSVTSIDSLISYDEKQKAADLESITGVDLSGLKGDNIGVDEKVHNVATVDLFDILPWTPGTTIWFHYTMECGNDILRGSYYNVPEGGGTAAMLAFGLGGLIYIHRRQKKVS